MLKELIKIANKLDEIGLTKEADILDDAVRKFAQEWDIIPNPGHDQNIYNDEQRKSRAIEESGRADRAMTNDSKRVQIKYIQKALGLGPNHITGTWDPITDKEFTHLIMQFATNTIIDTSTRDEYLNGLFRPGHYADGRFQVDAPKFVGNLDDATVLVDSIRNINLGGADYSNPANSAYPSPFENKNNDSDQLSMTSPPASTYEGGYFIVTSESSLFNNVNILAKKLGDTDSYSNVEGRIASLYNKYKRNPTLMRNLGRAFYSNFYKNIMKDTSKSVSISLGRMEPEYEKIWNQIKKDFPS